MKHHQPVTSHHLNLFAKFAPYLIEVQREQPHDSSLGSILSRVVCQPYLHPQQILLYQWLSDVCNRLTFDYSTSYVDPYTGFAPFTPPRFSSEYIERVHMILLERDIKVKRLEQSLTTIEKEFLAKQDEEVQRNP